VTDCPCAGRPHHDQCLCPSCCADKLRAWLKRAEARVEKLVRENKRLRGAK
jgi:hypothetical protein